MGEAEHAEHESLTEDQTHPDQPEDQVMENVEPAVIPEPQVQQEQAVVEVAEVEPELSHPEPEPEKASAEIPEEATEMAQPEPDQAVEEVIEEANEPEPEVVTQEPEVEEEAEQDMVADIEVSVVVGF